MSHASRQQQFVLRHVNQIPAVLEPGFLYVSAEYGTAAHLCACGCGSKIRTPLGPTEWTVEENSKGPTLEPSIGNWQRPCRSHYWIVEGRVRWAESWSAEQVEAGRRYEEARRKEYYDRARGGFFSGIWRRLVEWFWRLR